MEVSDSDLESISDIDPVVADKQSISDSSSIPIHQKSVSEEQ